MVRADLRNQEDEDERYDQMKSGVYSPWRLMAYQRL